MGRLLLAEACEDVPNGLSTVVVTLNRIFEPS